MCFLRGCLFRETSIAWFVMAITPTGTVSALHAAADSPMHPSPPFQLSCLLPCEGRAFSCLGPCCIFCTQSSAGTHRPSENICCMVMAAWSLHMHGPHFHVAILTRLQPGISTISPADVQLSPIPRQVSCFHNLFPGICRTLIPPPPPHCHPPEQSPLHGGPFLLHNDAPDSDLPTELWVQTALPSP